MTTSRSDVPALYKAAKEGHRPSLARCLSFIERGNAAARTLGALAYPDAGSGYTVGITGAPGAGKSTLTSAVVARMRADKIRLGVLAIDPSSPFTGGAILGDRVRMQEHALDDDVFIRSMATRGHLGGLALAAPEAVRLLEATGRPWILVETVGVGQVEVEIAGAADTTVVVVNPGWGDAVQANKAGLMEIADVFVINKADRAGADDTRRDLEYMLDLTGHTAGNKPGDGAWRPPVLSTVATSGEGLDDLWAAVQAHRAHIEQNGDLEARRQRRFNDELAHILRAQLEDRARQLQSGDDFAELRSQVEQRTIDPWEAVGRLIESRPSN
ncbi:MAG: LAO/AO transport system kinase [Acidimicrobiales bacterium]|jgi:LAO/AO transport system kinase